MNIYADVRKDDENVNEIVKVVYNWKILQYQEKLEYSRFKSYAHKEVKNKGRGTKFLYLFKTKI